MADKKRKKEVKQRKAVSIRLSEQEQEMLEHLTEALAMMSGAEVVRMLIRQTYYRIRKLEKEGAETSFLEP